MQGGAFGISLRQKVTSCPALNQFDSWRVQQVRVNGILDRVRFCLMDTPSEFFWPEPPVHGPLLCPCRFQSCRGHTSEPIDHFGETKRDESVLDIRRSVRIILLQNEPAVGKYVFWSLIENDQRRV